LVHHENYDAVVGTDVDLLKHPVVSAAVGTAAMGLRVVIDRRRRSLQDIVFRTRVVYLRPAAG
jgi:hypothetical protein